jgi:hypothetical protein
MREWNSARNLIGYAIDLTKPHAKTSARFVCAQWRQRPFITGIIAVQILTIIVALSLPRRANILPVGKEIVEAYELLGKTRTGRKLISRASQAASGSYIYLTVGDTEHDRLFDYSGEPVRALTRAVVRPGSGKCLVNRATVISNRNLLRSNVTEIAKSLAWELENICHLYGATCGCPDSDSPRAFATQRRIAAELEG